MKRYELAAMIREKNAAWAALAQAEMQELAVSEGYPELHEDRGDQRDEARAVHDDARGRYVRLAMRRRA